MANKVYLIMFDDFYASVTRVERVFSSKDRATEYLCELYSNYSSERAPELVNGSRLRLNNGCSYYIDECDILD